MMREAFGTWLLAIGFCRRDILELKAKGYWLKAIWLLAIWLMAGCVPTQTTPPLLRDDLGFRVTGDSYRSEQFAVRIPEGWRVVTGEYAAPPSLLMVAPDDCALIAVSSTPLEAAPISPTCATDELMTELRNADYGDGTLYIGGSAPADEWTAFTAILTQVAASVEG
jgi:hypothetical protein